MFHGNLEDGKIMIVDEKQVGQRFLIDLLRMEGKNEFTEEVQAKNKLSNDEDFENILLELELSDPDINEDIINTDFSESYDSKQIDHDQLIAITRQNLSDSQKSWRVTKVIIGMRKCYSA